MKSSRIEVVVTVPDELPHDLLVRTAMRTTLGVLVELIAESRNRLILASPFFQLASTVCRGPLGLALESAIRRGVLIDIVSTGGSLMEVDASTLSARRLPMAVRVSQPRSNFLDAKVMGSHAKFCLADDTAVYIGSANFTDNGLNKHFELGTLVRGQPAGDLFSIVNRLFAEEFFIVRGWLTIVSQE